MIVTLLLFTAYLSCQAAAVTHGIGRHRKDIPEKDLPIGFAAWMFAEIFYTASASVLKVAVGLFLERITQNRVHILIIRIMMAATMLIGTIYFFVCCNIPIFDQSKANPSRSLSSNVLQSHSTGTSHQTPKDTASAPWFWSSFLMLPLFSMAAPISSLVFYLSSSSRIST